METNESSHSRAMNNTDYCSVPNCKSRGRDDASLSFHRFPKPNTRFAHKKDTSGVIKKFDLYEAWTEATMLSHPTQRKKICSRHFDKNDYFFPGKVLFEKK